MTQRATGSFEVKLTAQKPNEEMGDGWPLGRMTSTRSSTAI